jgi:hypothetical protein
MSASEARLEAVSERLRQEIDAAQARVNALAQRRQQLAGQLMAVEAAEEGARRSLTSLLAVAGEAEPELGEHSDTRRLLAGVQLREMIARIALRQLGAGRPVHWSVWREWLREAGFDAAGKKPEATFLTQLARSPLVRRGERDGIYVLDVELFSRARDELGRLHDQLSQLPPPEQLALMGDVRARRHDLQNEVARVERAVEEMWRVLRAELPPGWPAGMEPEPDRIVRAWAPEANGRQRRLA